jgi:hypothetical protein
VKIATFAKPQNVGSKCKGRTDNNKQTTKYKNEIKN